MAVGRLPNHLDPFLVGEDHAESRPHQLLIVNQQHADASRGCHRLIDW